MDGMNVVGDLFGEGMFPAAGGEIRPRDETSGGLRKPFIEASKEKQQRQDGHRHREGRCARH